MAEFLPITCSPPPKPHPLRYFALNLFQAVIEAAEETGRDPDPPPFHYGTHYSCAGYILHYLLRLEPFTRLALGLQGGRFDKADRLFRDIRSSWESASSENLQVKMSSLGKEKY